MRLKYGSHVRILLAYHPDYPPDRVELTLTIAGTAAIMVYGYITPLSAFNDLEALLEKRPRHYSEDYAYWEMNQALMRYVKKYWPEVYAQIPQGEFHLDSSILYVT